SRNGRRPKRSDKTPIIGEKKNCIAAKTVRKTPFQIAVRVISLFTKLRIRFGNTGAINPSATMSSMTVTKMNGIAAWRFFIAREVSTQRSSGGGGKRQMSSEASVAQGARRGERLCY